MKEVISNRAEHFMAFAIEVERHIEGYTVPQYGDYPDDQMTEATLEDIKHDMMRYVNRLGRNARGPEEAQRDMLKLAHYAQIARDKMREERQ